MACGGPARWSILGAVLVVALTGLGVQAAEPEPEGDADLATITASLEVGAPLLLASLPVTRLTPRPADALTPRVDDVEVGIEFDAGPGLPATLARVLLSRSPDGAASYPSPYQIAPSTVVISGRVWSGSMARRVDAIFLRVSSAGAVGEEGRLETRSGRFELTEARGERRLQHIGQDSWRVGVDSDGRFRVVVRIESPIAGEAFHVEASGDAAFSCADSCARSAGFRLWKRVYLERDSMYRTGVAVTARADEESTWITVDDVRPFRGAREDRPVEVLLMGVTEDSLSRHEEPNLVVSVVRPDRREQAGRVQLAYPTLSRFDPGDAIVVPDDGVFELPSLETARSVFAKAFVEFVEVRNPHPFVPHRIFRVERLGEDFNAFAQRWSDYRRASHDEARNVVLVVSADHKTQTIPSGNETWHPAIGSCNLRPAKINNVFFWRGAVEQQVKDNDKGIGIGGRQPGDVMDELQVHELAHLFGVEDCASCGKLENSEGTGLSSMSVPVGPEMGDGVAGFHASEYQRIRTSVDPLPQG